MSFKTLGLGDNVADHYLHTNTIYPGGCSFNFAAYSSILGNESAYLGIVGNDYPAQHIIKTADEMNIDTSRCHIHFGPTLRPAVKIVDGERFFPETDSSDMSNGFTLILNKKDMAYIAGFDLIHTDVYAATEHCLEEVKELGVPIIMDLSTEYSEMYCRYVCKNVDYAIMSCSHITIDEMLERMKRVYAFGCIGVLATRGSEGSWFFDGSKTYHRDAVLVKAVDTQGAGDSFLTAFFSSYIKWSKEHDITDDAARENAIYAALDAASEFAGKMVLMDGAFGHGVEFKETETIF